MARLIINQSLRDALQVSDPGDTEAGMDGEWTLEASTVRELLQILEARHPGIRAALESGTAVAIDGEIHAHALLHPLSEDSEVCFIPAIEGG